MLFRSSSKMKPGTYTASAAGMNDDVTVEVEVTENEIKSVKVRESGLWVMQALNIVYTNVTALILYKGCQKYLFIFIPVYTPI